MLDLWGVKSELGLLVAGDVMSVGFLRKSQHHLPRHTRFVLLRILRYRTEDTLGERKVQSESEIRSTYLYGAHSKTSRLFLRRIGRKVG